MKKLFRRLLTMLPMLTMGMICGILVGRYGLYAEENGFPAGLFGAIGILFLGFVLGLFLQIAVHEAGHLVFGLLTGYKFCSYRLGNLMLQLEDGRLRLRRMTLAGTGGQCLMAPPPWSEDLPAVLYNLGGCLMNLLSAALCLVLWLPLRHHWLGGLPLVCGLVGLVFALLNGIPMKVGGIDNDGRNALSLRKSKTALYAFWLQMKVSEAQTKGLRLYQMPDNWFTWPEAQLDNPLVATIAVFACNRMMDQQRFGEAESAMTQLLAQNTGMPGLYRSLLTCDSIFCKLLAGNTADARALVTDDVQTFMKSMKTFPSVLRTQYALAVLADHDPAKGETILAAFDKMAATYPYPADIESERELLAQVRATTV